MKILQIMPTFIPSRFGGISVFYNLSKNLVKRGHEVVVFTTDIKDRYSRLSNIEGGRDIDGIKVYYFKNVSNSLATKHRLSVPKGMTAAIKRRISNFDIIHLHNVRTFQNVIIHHYAKKYDIPYVVQARGSLLTFFHKGWQKRIFDVIWGHGILEDASKLIALTPIEAAQYRNTGINEGKIEIIPNGIDLSEFNNLPERGEFRRKYGLGDNQRIILFVGRIHKAKGLNLLVRAFAELSRLLENIKLVIVGPDDGYLPSLKKLIADLEISNELLFTGYLDGEDKVEAYVDADVFVLPSIYEIFGNVVLEACACGTPVVITDHCGIADAIDGQAGLVVPYDKKALGKAILEILSDEKRRQEFGERGKSLIRQQFDWLKIAEQIEHTYASCISSGRQIMG